MNLVTLITQQLAQLWATEIKSMVQLFQATKGLTCLECKLQMEIILMYKQMAFLNLITHILNQIEQLKRSTTLLVLNYQAQIDVDKMLLLQNYPLSSLLILSDRSLEAQVLNLCPLRRIALGLEIKYLSLIIKQTTNLI